MSRVVIVSAVRTPIGNLNGGLSSFSSITLGGAVIRAALDRSRIDLVHDLPGQIWSRMNGRLDRNQGGQGHAQETVYARRDHATFANGRVGDQQRARGA